MAAPLVDGSDALFESKQAFVDLCTLHSSLPVITLSIGRSLWPSQVDQKKFSNVLSASIFDFDLADCMWPRRCIISCSTVSGSLTVSKVYNAIHLLLAAGLSLSQPRNLDFWVTIFLNLEFLFPIEKITHFASIYFKKAHVEKHSLRCDLEHVPDCALSGCSNSERLPRSGLSIRKESYYALLEDRRKQVFDLIVV